MSSRATTPTLTDVADAAGVVVSTVSNAFNRPERVSPELRQQILDVADQLGFRRPNPLASSLRTGTTHTVGLVLPGSLHDGLSDPATTLIAAGIGEVLEPAAKNLLLISTQQHPERLGTAIVDGFIAYTPGDHDRLVNDLKTRHLPMVTIDGEHERCVTTDDIGGATKQVDHLANLGHTEIGFLVDDPNHAGGPRTWHDVTTSDHHVNRQRVTAWQDACTRHGITGHLFSTRDCTERAGYEIAHLLSATAATAITCTADRLAIGVLDACRDHGISVPHDLSVIGYDDLPIAKAHQLTTIKQSHRDKGRLAAQTLLGGPPRPPALPTNLIERTTTARLQPPAD